MGNKILLKVNDLGFLSTASLRAAVSGYCNATVREDHDYVLIEAPHHAIPLLREFLLKNFSIKPGQTA